MKKKIFLTAFLVITIIFTGVLVIKYSKNKEYKKNIYDISNINYKQFTLEGTQFYEKEEYNCFLIFSSDCDFCIDEIEDIVDNIDMFKNVNFYLVSNQTKEQLQDYNEDSEFLGLKNFTIIHDKDGLLIDFFGFPITPSTYIYNNDKKLLSFKKGFIEYYSLKNMLGQ